MLRAGSSFKPCARPAEISDLPFCQTKRAGRLTSRRHFAAVAEQVPDARIIDTDAVLLSNRKSIVEFAAAHDFPAMYGLREFVDDGGLMSYGPVAFDIWRCVAGYVDKILKGAKPADLPVQQPTKFELVVNLNTAKALGLTIPQSILARADEVIE